MSIITRNELLSIVIVYLFNEFEKCVNLENRNFVNFITLKFLNEIFFRKFLLYGNILFMDYLVYYKSCMNCIFYITY